MKPGIPPLQAVRSLDQMRERIWSLHYRLKIEKTLNILRLRHRH